MKKFISIVLALAVSFTFFGFSPQRVEGGQTINAVFSGYGATFAHAIETGDDHFWGTACWRNVGDSVKFEMNIAPSVFGITFKVDQIQSISFHTKKPTTGPQDFYLVVYTAPDGVNDHGFYGYRLIAEPYFSKNLNAPSNQWNLWSTDPGTNQLTFFDPDTTGSFGAYGQPTLQDIQSGPINWNSFQSSWPLTSIDYSVETVKYISFQTATNWTQGFLGLLDAISISLADGTVANIDLENTLWVDDDWAGKLPTTPILLPDGRYAFFGGNAFSTIQEAIDAASNGGTVNVFPGIYNKDEANDRDYLNGGPGIYDFNIFVDKPLTIQGVKGDGTPVTSLNDISAKIIPKRDTPSGNLSTIFVQADKVTISGLDITAYYDPDYNFKTISVIGNNVTIKNCKIYAGDQVSCIYMYDPRYNPATDTSYLTSYTIQGNLLDAGGIEAAGIRISSGPGWTGDVSSRLISNNTFQGGSYGIQFVGPGGDPWDFYPVGAATITGNTFSGQDRGSVVAWGKYKDAQGYGNIDWDAVLSGNTFDKAVVVRAPDNTIRYYDFSYTDPNGVHNFFFIRGIYSGIQRYPINRVAQSGDTIVVGPGLYQEQIIVDKTLKLLGAQANVDPRPSKGGRSGPESVIETAGQAMYITAPDVEVNGFTFRSKINNKEWNVVYAYNASNPKILYNIVYNDQPSGRQSNEGIKVRYAYDSGATVSYNYVFDIPSPGDAINFDFVNNGVISFNEVRNSGSENAAIYVYNSLNTTIEGNIVDTTTQNDGIKLGSKNGSDAAKTGGKVIDNIVRNTIQDGISIYMSNVLVEGNEVTGSTSENGAIYLAQAISNVTIRCNDIHHNTLNTTKWGNPGGIMIGTGVNVSTVTVDCNNIFNNYPNGVTNKAAGTLNAENNWWGDPGGPSGQGPGTGDAVSENVDFDPWLSYPACYPSMEITVEKPTVSVDEGQTVQNSGTFSPTDGFKSISSSIGAVTPNLNEGEWSWTYTPEDDTGTPSEVTITFVREYNLPTQKLDLSAKATFQLIVNNLPPVCGPIQGIPSAPVQVGTSINLSCSFTDPGILDTHTASWNWGDKTTSPATVVENGGSGTVSGSHTYNTPGVFQITLTVTDDDGGTCTCQAPDFIVVFDPTGGFVTGGGWINSPKGAYIPNPELSGKATFGFVAKYQKGANVPAGNTEFQFKAGNLTFKSTSYEWLVVAGNKAKFKGEGSLNGIGGYKFMLTAVDGQYNKGTDPDTFRIKIWKDDVVIYDNMLGTSDDSYDGTVLGGGEIVIHK